MGIEQLLNKLNEIVEKMEDENTKLDESLALFEEGVTLAKRCFDSIEEYKGKLTVIKEKLDGLGA